MKYKEPFNITLPGKGTIYYLWQPFGKSESTS